MQYTNRSRSASATLTTDTAAQVGSVPSNDHRPVVAAGSDDGRLRGEQVTQRGGDHRRGQEGEHPQLRLGGRDRDRACRSRGCGTSTTATGTPRACSSSAPPPAGEPSQQIRDPQLAAQAFYGVAAHTHNPGLVDITGWQSMSVAAAAQAVQISAFPSAYAKWEAAARAVVQQLGDGQTLTTTPLLCGTGQDAQLGECPATGSPAEKGLTRDALLVLRCAKAKFPSLTDFGGKHPDPLPDHPSGRAVDIMIPDYRTAEGKAFGWQIAHWLQDNRQALGVQYLIFDAKIWNIDRDREGWRTYSPGYTGSINDSSLHRNHVHVTVYGNAGTGFQPDDGGTTRRRRAVDDGRWPDGLHRRLRVRLLRVRGRAAAHRAGLPDVRIGTAVRSTNAGTVEVSKDLNGSYGRYIVIRDAADPKIAVYYAHLSVRERPRRAAGHAPGR